MNGMTQTMLNSVSATGAGAAFSSSELTRAFQVVITDTATCVLEASMFEDFSTVVTLRTSTASEGYSTLEPWPYMRGNVTAYTSGTVTLVMAT